MGLHLNYELRLPSTTSSAEVNTLLERLRERAISLGFPLMTRMTTWSEAEEEWQQVFRIMTDFVGEFVKHNELSPINLESARGFLVHPGRGCEPASIGFVERISNDGGHPEWFWYCRCKTQYASVFGDDYFLVCQGRLVNLLDEAIALGVAVVVRDETFYWPTRDPELALEEVRNMNSIVARLAGAFSDQVSGVGSPIFGHPDFERLETER